MFTDHPHLAQHPQHPNHHLLPEVLAQLVMSLVKLSIGYLLAI